MDAILSNLFEFGLNYSNFEENIEMRSSSGRQAYDYCGLNFAPECHYITIQGSQFTDHNLVKWFKANFKAFVNQVNLGLEGFTLSLSSSRGKLDISSSNFSGAMYSFYPRLASCDFTYDDARNNFIGMNSTQKFSFDEFFMSSALSNVASSHFLLRNYYGSYFFFKYFKSDLLKRFKSN